MLKVIPLDIFKVLDLRGVHFDLVERGLKRSEERKNGHGSSREDVKTNRTFGSYMTHSLLLGCHDGC